jgi:predicted MFS family arabinose efflux permease
MTPVKAGKLCKSDTFLKLMIEVGTFRLSRTLDIMLWKLPIERESGLGKGKLPQGFLFVVFAKFISNVAYRMIFPFLPVVARGIGVSTATLGTTLALRDLGEMAGPALGKMTDRRGTRQVMIAALFGLGMAAALQGASNGLIIFTFGLVAISITKMSFDVGSSSWIGAHVSFNDRSRAIGIVEMTWAFSFIIGMPLAALLIRLGTWRTPFIAISVLCLVTSAALWTYLPAPTLADSETINTQWTARIRFALFAMVALGTGHMMMLVTFATFLEDQHGVSTSGLGLFALVIGLAELVGSGGVAFFGDRLGKTTVVKWALFLSLPLSLLLPFGESGYVTALVLISAWFICTESVIVSMLSICTELDGNARGAMMGFVYASWSIGRFFGAITGALLYDWRGIKPVAFTMSAALFIGLILVIVGFRDSQEPAVDFTGSGS